MSSHKFTLAGADLEALPTGALWWPAAQLLCVADLHLGKAERTARRGGPLLPPYEPVETLTRLARDIAATQPRTVVCLGDSFDDPATVAALDPTVEAALATLIAGRRWIWVEGNHDPGPVHGAGTHVDALERGSLVFRHITERQMPGGEVSGHFHPKMRVGNTSRPAFLLCGARLILPAYGCYTGGLRIDDPAFARFTQAGGIAILTGRKARPVPVPATGAATA